MGKVIDKIRPSNISILFTIILLFTIGIISELIRRIISIWTLWVMASERNKDNNLKWNL